MTRKTTAVRISGIIACFCVAAGAGGRRLGRLLGRGGVEGHGAEGQLVAAGGVDAGRGGHAALQRRPGSCPSGSAFELTRTATDWLLTVPGACCDGLGLLVGLARLGVLGVRVVAVPAGRGQRRRRDRAGRAARRRAACRCRTGCSARSGCRSSAAARWRPARCSGWWSTPGRRTSVALTWTSALFCPRTAARYDVHLGLHRPVVGRRSGCRRRPRPRPRPGRPGGCRWSRPPSRCLDDEVRDARPDQVHDGLDLRRRTASGRRASSRAPRRRSGSCWSGRSSGWPAGRC